MKNNFASLVSTSAAVVLATLSAAPVLAQQAQTDKPAGMATASTTRTATVTHIDKQDRWVTLKLADGRLVDIQAGPAVKNFDQIKVGDIVTAQQDDTVAIEVLRGAGSAERLGRLGHRVRRTRGQADGDLVDKTVVSGKITAIDFPPAGHAAGPRRQFAHDRGRPGWSEIRRQPATVVVLPEPNRPPSSAAPRTRPNGCCSATG